MNNFISDIFGKKVLVFGLGRQGGGAGDSEWLKKHGAIVRLSDKDTSLVKEGQTKEQIDWADIIIKNPGVPDDNELILSAKALGKEIYTSIALFVKYSGIKTIGVTGTRGKSTTVALIGDLLDAAYPGQVIRGGNIAGTSCLALFDQLEGIAYAVLELSSFQLHNFHELRVSPNIAVVTNLYPDHLNRYKTIDDYRLDKEAVCKYQTPSDTCIYNSQNPGAQEISRISKAKLVPFSFSQCESWQTTLPGAHNKENIAAMAALAKVLGINESIAKQVVADFSGVPFRQEVIATLGGVTYINDTTSTTPTAARIALLAATTPTVWITGGDTKNLPFFDLIAVAASCPLLKKVVILGSKNIPDYVNALKDVVGDKIVGTATSMSEAVGMAKSVAEPGDAILLSPGFASFDLFKNEFDRGIQFNDIVKSYAQN
jgi:UDP-N-acetylmuramoylalanine--D-glutamate ligase